MVLLGDLQEAPEVTKNRKEAILCRLGTISAICWSVRTDRWHPSRLAEITIKEAF